MFNKEKINIKVSSLKKSLLRDSKQAIDWEIIFAKHIADKRMYPNYTKNFKISANSHIKKWAKDLNRHLTRKHTQNVNIYEKMLNII